MTRTRVLLADDHRPMLEQVESLLSADFEVVGAVSDGLILLEAAQRLAPELLVIDISMPGLTGIEVAQRLKEEGATGKIVILTVHDDRDFMRAAREAGALGFVVKARLAVDLRPAIDNALAGHCFVSPTVKLSAE